MRKLGLIALSLILGLTVVGCASSGPVAKQIACPKVPRPPASLANKTDYVGKICGVFLDGLENCKPSETR